MRIVILGGCGFIGSNIAIFLKKNLIKTKIISIDNFFRKGSKINYKRLKDNNIKNLKKDISIESSLKNLGKVDLFIDCCADPAIENSKKNINTVIKNNFLTTLNILNKTIEKKTPIIFLSTSRVYSIKKINNLIKRKNYKETFNLKNKISENFNTTDIKSIYGLTKLSSEDLIKEYSYLFNIKYIINRCGVISGPWQLGKQEQGLFSFWMKNHILKSRIKYIGYGGYGNQVRDVLHIDDLCNLILLQINNLKRINNKTFNVGGGNKNKISLIKLTKICEKITHNKCKIEHIPQTSNYDIPYYVSDIKKVKKFYKWKPKKNVLRLMKDIYVWMKKYKINLKDF